MGRAGAGGGAQRVALLALEAAALVMALWAVGVDPPILASPYGPLHFPGGGWLAVGLVFVFVKQVASACGLDGRPENGFAFRGRSLAILAVAVLIVASRTAHGETSSLGALHGLGFVAAAVAVHLVFEELLTRRLVARGAALRAPRARRVALLGPEPACRALAERFASAADRYSVVGLFDPDALAAGVGDPDGPTGQLIRRIRCGSVDEVIIVLGQSQTGALVAVVERLLDYPVDLAVTPPELGELVGRITPSAGPLVVALLRQPVRGPGAVAKRTIDLVLAATAAFVLAPFLLLTAVAIKLDSAGPILFRQMRAGYGQSQFQVWKFRTMRHDAESGVFRQARQADDRVTRVGRVLRRWSIDELPQLFNVLRGEMSLVGPRPHPLPLNERFQPLIPLYNVRHRVHPGITGLAQVNGCRGETDTVEKMAQRVAYDLQYIRTWSIWLDLWIILLTASGRFTHRNAY